MRGYFGIGIYDPKKAPNIGTLWRSAHCFGADFMFTVGGRYKKDYADTTDATKHVPFYEYETLEDIQPKDADIVCVEIFEYAQDLKTFKHPERAIYILGAEDYGLPAEFLQEHQSIKIPSTYCLNVAVTGSIVLYDRVSKG